MPPTKNPPTRPLPQTTREETVARPHPSRGGTRGYDVAIREMALAVRANGQEGDPIFDGLRNQHSYPNQRSTRRWEHKLLVEGNALPYEMNGNSAAVTLRGNKLLMLVIFRFMYPKATAAEVNAFLFNCTLPGEQYRFYSESQITAAEQFVGLSRKRGSTTAYQASLPINLAKRHSFWNDPYPFGINGTSRSTIIDWDEAAIFVETTNRGYGKCYINRRVKEEGPYNHSDKYTLIAAIRGGNNGGCWIDIALRSGTTVINTYDFLHTIINQIGVGGVNVATGVNNTHTFICDNLSSHKNPLIRLLINNNRHRLVFRAPYYPCDGPIEYFFNHLQQQLTMELYRVRNAADLQQAIIAICQRCNGAFDRYFAHCGYAP